MNEKGSSYLSQFQVMTKLGKGGYASVYLVKRKNVKYALKKIDRFVNNRDHMKSILSEINLLKTMNHPNIIKLYEWHEDIRNEKYFLLFEYFDCCDLNNFYRESIPSESDAIHIIRQIASAIKYCHDNWIVHRDIKTANILINSSLTIKLIDFGLSVRKKKADSLCSSDVGTTRFKAPEIICHRPYNQTVDIWSFGVVIYILLTGMYPFNGESPPIIESHICQARFDTSQSTLSPTQIHLLKHIFVINPAHRYSINDIINHPWLTSSSTPAITSSRPHNQTVHNLSTSSLSSSSHSQNTICTRCGQSHINS